MTVNSLISTGTALLVNAGVPEAELDARLLWQHLSGWDRATLILKGNEVADHGLVTRYQQFIAQRCARVPLHYLTGSREFWSMDFLVTPDVLIPRPETEFLLESVLNACLPASVHRALDMCTGSGVIAVVLAKELGCLVDAIDISPAALAVAEQNVARHKADGLVRFIGSDLFASIEPGTGYDLIVSNPPYIADGQLNKLEPEVAQAEPRLALSGGASGLAAIERIIGAAWKFLKPHGFLFLEIGADQESEVMGLITTPPLPYDDCVVLKDWSGRPRVLKARLGNGSSL